MCVIFQKHFLHTFFLSWNVFLCSKDASRRGLSIDIKNSSQLEQEVCQNKIGASRFSRLNFRIWPPARRAVHVRVRRDVRGGIIGRLGAKIEFSGAASNIALTSPSSWKEFNISKVASDDGLSFEL